jgi:hypothetical protein
MLLPARIGYALACAMFIFSIGLVWSLGVVRITPATSPNKQLSPPQVMVEHHDTSRRTRVLALSGTNPEVNLHGLKSMERTLQAGF